MDHQPEGYVEQNRKRFEDLLGQMVNIASISVDPAKQMTRGSWQLLRGKY